MVGRYVRSQSMEQAFIVLLLIGCSIKPIMSSTIQKKSIFVNEEEEAGTVVARMKDFLQISENGTIAPTFKILTQKVVVDKVTSRRKQLNPSRTWLTIDENSGEITCLRRFDRETDCLGSKICEVVVKAVMLPQEQFSLIQFNITVVDINDNAPTFRQNLVPVNISEETSVGSTINIEMYRAKDKDLGVNGEITYKLTENKVFQLRQYRGLTGDSRIELILQRKLDYETQKQFTLQLTATDNGKRKKISSVVDLNISVIDENDNDPVFAEEEYQVTLKENLPAGYVIKTVRAADLDSGIFGRVRYFLSDRDENSGHENMFRDFVKVNEVTGEVSLIQHLDREMHNGVRIPIEARDGDVENQKIGHTWLLVRVIDINDNAPVITVNFIIDSDGNKAFLPESSSIGTFVASVIVSDADDGRNGEVTTTITTQGLSASGDFYEDAKDTFKLVKGGLIQTTKEIDREICNQYQLLITACDEGVDRNCTKKTVDIDILDVNEHEPVFETTKKHVTLREDSMVGTILTSVQAYDGDSENMPSFRKNKEAKVVPSENGNIVYSISGDERRFFSIDSVTGKIILERSLDRESHSVWRINVIAKDKGVPHPLEGRTLVEVEVTDVNDNTPAFTNPAVNNSLVYASTQDNERVVARVQATDKDSGSNAMLRYSIVQSPERIRDLFVIDSVSGEVSFSKGADVNNSNILHREHEIMIQASDSGSPSLSVVTLLRIHITNEQLKIDSVSQITPLEAPVMNFMILAIGLGSATILLIVVIIIIIIKCRRENEKVRTYRCRDAEAKTSSCVSCNCHESVDDVRSETNTTPSNTETNSTAVNSCNKDVGWNATNNRHETDSVMSGSAGYSSNSSHLTKSDVSATHVGRYQSSPNGRLPTITVLTAMDNNVTSPIKKICGRLHSIQDSDSGRGESETDVGSYDVVLESGGKVNKRCPLGRDLDDVFQREMQEYQMRSAGGALGPRCNEQCLRFGHSDTCWMPSPEKKAGGQRLACIRETQLPPINTARIMPIKPRHYSDRSQYSSNDVFLPRSCTKATSIDQISQISSSCSAPERSVSNEQHFISSSDNRTTYNKMASYPAACYNRHHSLTRDGNVGTSYKTSAFVSGRNRKTRSADKILKSDRNQEEESLLLKPRITSEETKHIIDNINKLLV